MLPLGTRCVHAAYTSGDSGTRHRRLAWGQLAVGTAIRSAIRARFAQGGLSPAQPARGGGMIASSQVTASRRDSGLIVTALPGLNAFNAA